MDPNPDQDPQALTDENFEAAAKILGCEVAVIKAVAEVESGHHGGFCPDGFPVILFEGHIFARYTKDVYSKNYPTISYPEWTTKFYGLTWQAERERFKLAITLNHNAALMSSSWGRFQIMGFNFGLCDCVTIQQFVNRMCKDEMHQLDLFCKYIIHTGLDDELRNMQWHEFARRYNGPLYQRNNYVSKLEQAYQRNGGTA